MEIRVLRYFLEVAREGNITHAAKRLHITQPTLSKQIKDLEEELGKKLFVRTNMNVSMTPEGMLLRKRAEEILTLVDKTVDEFKGLDDLIGGTVRIGCAESYLNKYLARAVKRARVKYPGLYVDMISGNTEQIHERIQKGLMDFAIIVNPPDLTEYNYIEMPEQDTWGMVLRKDHPLAQKDSITFDDLIGENLIISSQALHNEIALWCGDNIDKLTVIAKGNLVYNASLFVKEGVCIMASFKNLVYTGKDTELCFRPLDPPLKSQMYLIWKKYQIFTPIAAALLDELKAELHVTS